MENDPGHDGWFFPADPETVTLLLISLFSALVIGAAVSDLRRYVIPNWIPAAIALLWCLWAVVTPANPLNSLLVGGCVFAVGTVLFAFRAFGGGDVKLLSAIALWAGGSEILLLVFHVALAGGALSLVWVLSGPLRLALAYYGAPVSATTPKRVPYGVAIAAGGLLMAARLAEL